MKILDSRLLLSASHSTQTSRINVKDAPARTPATAETGAVINRSLQASASDHASAQATLTGSDGLISSATQQQWSRQQSINQFASASMASTSLPARNNTLASRINLHTVQEESELLTYRISGSLTLEDSRQLDFSITGNMSRQLRLEEASGIYAANVQRKDPLVVNFAAGNVQLTEKAFAFDLDADGKKEQVSFATGGSGFLFLDGNGNGALDDGRELFGTQSGDGFADLARFDDDGNGFIDDGDAIFQQLRTYSRNEAGDEQIQSLSSLGIAAIGLENIATPMELTSTWQHSLGQLRATGIGVGHSGQVFTVQQVDLTLRDSESEHRFELAFATQDTGQGQSAAAAPASLPEGLEQAMQRLREMTEGMLARLDKLANPEQAPEAKSMLEQLVERLEEYTAGQQGRERTGHRRNTTAD